MIAPYLTSSLVNLLKPENTSQLKILKNPNSIRMNDFLINWSIPVTLHSNMLTFKHSKKPFKLDGDALKMMNNYNFIVIHSNPQDQKVIIDCGKKWISILTG